MILNVYVNVIKFSKNTIEENIFYFQHLIKEYVKLFIKTWLSRAPGHAKHVQVAPPVLNLARFHCNPNMNLLYCTEPWVVVPKPETVQLISREATSFASFTGLTTFVKINGLEK